MDQELKQRLIGAVVITALAAIFVPMLFDDPVDETGKRINELEIPSLPAKAQDSTQLPLPEKAADVVAGAGQRALKEAEQPAEVEVVEDEAEPAPRVKMQIAEADVKPVPTPPEDQEDAFVAENKPPKAIAKSPKPESKSLQPPVEQPLKPIRPEMKAPPVLKSAPAEEDDMATAKPVTLLPASTPIVNTRWFLQVGTFSQKANAVALQDSLKQQGFTATIKEMTGDKGSIFKVRVGPMLDKAKAQAIKAKLLQMNVNSFISADE